MKYRTLLFPNNCYISQFGTDSTNFEKKSGEICQSREIFWMNLSFGFCCRVRLSQLFRRGRDCALCVSELPLQRIAIQWNEPSRGVFACQLNRIICQRFFEGLSRRLTAVISGKHALAKWWGLPERAKSLGKRSFPVCRVLCQRRWNLVPPLSFLPD